MLHYLKGLWSDDRGLVMNVVEIIIGLILLLNVLLPSAKTAVSNANLSGTDALIAGFFSTFIVIGALVMIVRGTIGIKES
jgi:hypothetical protein